MRTRAIVLRLLLLLAGWLGTPHLLRKTARSQSNKTTTWACSPTNRHIVKTSPFIRPTHTQRHTLQACSSAGAAARLETRKCKICEWLYTPVHRSFGTLVNFSFLSLMQGDQQIMQLVLLYVLWVGSMIFASVINTNYIYDGCKISKDVWLSCAIATPLDVCCRRHLVLLRARINDRNVSVNTLACACVNALHACTHVAHQQNMPGIYHAIPR